MHICYETVSLPGVDVIRVRDSNKDLRLVDFVSRAKLVWNRKHASREKGRLAAASISPPAPFCLSNGPPVIGAHSSSDEKIVY